MNEKAIRIILRRELLAGLARSGVSDLPVIAAQQPTTQGREDRGLYFFVASDTSESWQGRSYEKLPDTPMTMTDTSSDSTMFQVEVLSPDNPEDLTERSALDLLRLSRVIIQSLPFVDACRKAGIGIQRPTNIRSPYFTNDRDQFEMSPSFDFTVSHETAIIQSTNSIDTLEVDIHTI